jgi:hypothetical protein
MAGTCTRPGLRGRSGGAREGFELGNSVLVPMTAVEVWCFSTGRWVGGFRVASIADGMVQLERTIDGVVLPTTFPVDSVRPVRSGTGDWWHTRSPVTTRRMAPRRSRL